MIDKHKIFGLFGNDENTQSLAGIPKQMLNEPFTKLGMFTKLIINHQVFHTKLEKFLKVENPNYNVEDTKSASEYTVYNRAYHYIKGIDLKDINHLEAIMDFKRKELLNSLNKSIQYFEQEEEYEKCAFLMKIKTFKKDIKDSVPL